jgi:hypothetical protein
MKISKWIFIISCFALVSCASNFEEEKREILKGEEKRDLIQSFDVSKNDVDSTAFQEKEIVTGVTSSVPTAAVPSKSGKEKKTVVDTKKATTNANIEVKKTEPVVLKPEEKVLQMAGEYPADYPKEYIQYDKKSKDIWSKFNPFFFKGEQTIMAVTYLGVTAGYITITSKNVVNINDKIAFNYNARFKSSDSYSYFYWLDDQLNTFVEKDTFLPIKYSLIQREKKQDVDDLQLFDFQKLRTFTFYKRVKKDSNKNEKLNVYVPKYAQDSFSALQFVRGLPLKKGDKYEFPVITRGKVWLLKVDVAGTETIEVMDKEVSAIKIKAETHFPGVLKKSGDIYFWYSNDEARRLLKFQAQIKIGALKGEVVDYKAGEKLK